MKNLKIGIKIAVGFGAVLFLVVVMILMVLIGNISIGSAVTSSSLASELQVKGKDILFAYSVLKDDVTTLEILYDDGAYAQAKEYLAKCRQDVAEMQEYSQSNKELNNFLPLLETLGASLDKWGGSIDELQASNKRLKAVVDATYKSGEMLSSRSRVVFDMQMEELSREADADITTLQRLERIGYVRDGQKISDDIANSRRRLEVMLATFDMNGFDDALKSLEGTLTPIRQYSQAAISDADRSATQKLEALVVEYLDYVLTYEKEIGLSEECIAIEKGYSEQVRQDLDALLVELDRESTYQTNATLKASQTSLAMVIVSASLALLFGVLIAVFIVRSVTRPISLMVKAADGIAVGDVDVEIEVDSEDEIGVLGRAFRRIIDSMREQVRYMEKLSEGDMSFDVHVRSDKDIMNLGFKKLCENMSDIFIHLKETAALVAEASNDIAQGSQDVANGTSQQASSIQQFSASLGDITRQTKGNSELAAKASELGNKIKEDAERGDRQMEQMVGAVNEITEASRSIGSVIKIIDDIAFQTNILALNAAVEAARAGQHGKGFAVVADEVRNLASKSAEAAKDTSAMIENTIKKAEFGANIATETSDSLKKIVDGIMESTRIVGTIARYSETQAESVEQINQGIGLVSDVIQRNTATSEQSAAAANRMKDQSHELSGLISAFKLADRK